ncbi:phosphoribosylglycinamide formyltransferase [Erythrobacter sp. SD-21]|uniref:phosphoribosylglycinamide formyltransferase n=1 Tax=Erythrobacter sp. SD-21 TaxID=161528 RepID=UPI000153F899|nr:phosphoribosylglycinamide formyltransferase [Erythrobacter sp. SD-21]EDL48579.1 Phosphoribosylglycinamide formyltransferase protein [Erythrobacter sp. SD-21]
MADKAKVAIFLSGRGSNMAALLYASRLPDAAYEVVLVAANDPEAEGLALAVAEGVATFARSHKGMTRADHDAAMGRAARDAGADYIVLAGYMRILTDAFAASWEGRMLNIHPSLLPKYPGLDTHQRAIDAGDSHGGVSVHLVTPELDAGEVLGQMQVAIRKGETADSLAERVRYAEHQLYPRVVNDYLCRENDPAFLLEKVRELALALPQSHERESHGSPGWRAGSEKSGKYFAYFNDQHHGSEHIAVLVKAGSIDELFDLVEAQPQAYFKPAYYGASGWLGVILNRPGLDWDHVADWLKRSWRSVAPKSATKLIDAAEQF